MRIIFISLLLIVSNICHAQTWAWAKGGLGSLQEGWVAAADPAGNIIHGGYFYATVLFSPYTLTSLGNTDTYIVKYDANGNIQWLRQIGSNGDETIGAITTDQNGNIYVTGSSNSQSLTVGAFTISNAMGGYQPFFIKYDPSGNVLWATAGSGTAEGVGVTVDPAGNPVFMGNFSSASISFGSIVINNTGFRNFYIVKYDANGNPQWAQSSVGDGNGLTPTYGSVWADAAANIYITGQYTSPTISFGPFTLDNGTGIRRNTFIVKYSAAGDPVWARTSVSPPTTISFQNLAYHISGDNEANIYLGGHFSADSIIFGNLTLYNSQGGGSPTPFLVKYDSSGNALWAKRGDGRGITYAVCTYPGGVYIAGGFTNGPISFGTYTLSQPATAPDPMYLVNYDTNGNELGATSLSSGGDDMSAIVVDGFCNLYVVGDFISNPFHIGSITLLPDGVENAFTAKLSLACTLPVSILNFKAAPLSAKAIRLAWQTAEETNVEAYMVERSIKASDGFIAIGTIPAKTNARENNYVFKDNDVEPGVLYYYRLAIIEHGIVNKYSEIRTAKTSETIFNDIQYTNPTTGIVYFSGLQLSGTGAISFTDNSGRVLIRTGLVFSGNAGFVDISKLPTGLYWMNIECAGRRYVKKIIKL